MTVTTTAKGIHPMQQRVPPDAVGISTRRPLVSRRIEDNPICLESDLLAYRAEQKRAEQSRIDAQVAKKKKGKRV
jgi:hypothetical protein